MVLRQTVPPQARGKIIDRAECGPQPDWAQSFFSSNVVALALVPSFTLSENNISIFLVLSRQYQKALVSGSMLQTGRDEENCSIALV